MDAQENICPDPVSWRRRTSLTGTQRFLGVVVLTWWRTGCSSYQLLRPRRHEVVAEQVKPASGAAEAFARVLCCFAKRRDRHSPNVSATTNTHAHLRATLAR
ncbi:unnamed protein product, partial [Prorocentrum cordatum]